MKKEIIITVLLLALVVVLAWGLKFSAKTFEEGDAKKFVLEDLQSKFPSADKVGIINTELRTNEKGEKYYFMKGSVSFGLSTPCPTRTYYYYNYPTQNFVPAPPEPIVMGCKVCSGSGCIIAFDEEAIIASHTSTGSLAVQEYIDQYKDAAPSVTKVSNGWRVIWRAASANYSYIVVVGNEANIANLEKA